MGCTGTGSGGVATGWRRTTAAALLGLTLLAASCSSDGSDGAGGGDPKAGATTTAVEDSGDGGGSGADGAGDGATTTTIEPGPVEEFTTGDFYEVPDPLPPGSPGQLIRVQEMGTTDGNATVKVMYHSIDSQGRDRAATGLITYPTAPAPEDGWPVTAWEHGTYGLAPQCAPSRIRKEADDQGIEGVRVAPDYIGLGPNGERHSYLNGTSEGHSVIDVVRAARQLPAAHAGTRWVAAGHSQGGHAALWSHELAQTYAPELELLGTAVLAPASVLDKTFGPDDQVIPKVVGLMGLFGAEEDPDIDVDDYLGDKPEENRHLIDDACLDDISIGFAGYSDDVLYDHDPRTTEPAKSYLEAQDPGHVAVEAPMLLIEGGADTWVVPDRVQYLYEQLCDLGMTTELAVYPTGTHGTVVDQSWDDITTWFEARFAGEDPKDTCP